MKTKFKQAYMDVARRFAELSSARRLHVGAIVVKDDRIISIGYNGMPAGWDNVCEDEIYADVESIDWIDPVEIWHEYPHQSHDGRPFKLVTKPEVLHAEMNCLMKLAKSVESGNNASMFITHAPCLDCAKGIYQAGISEVYYGDDYRSESGIYFLQKCGVKIEKLIKDSN